MMKRFFLLYIMSLMVSSVSAQYESTVEDETSRFRPGIFWYYHGLKPARTEKARKYDRLIFDLTYNTWTGDLDAFKSKPSSIGLGTNLIFDVPLKKGNPISFGWGFNHHWTHIRHDETFYNNLEKKYTEFAIAPYEARASLNFHQISVPLEFRFRKESWRHFKFHIGGKIGYLFGMNENERLENPYGKTVIKNYNFQDEVPLQYSAHLRLGIRNIALFGEYNFSKLFSNSLSTQLNTLRCGISFSVF